MAQGFRFVCHKCDHAIVAWDDGNPYYLETVMTKIDMEKRQFAEVKHKKKYAYHPNHELLDAARADAFSHDAAPTPAADALAMDGTRFRGARAPAPWTG